MPAKFRTIRELQRELQARRQQLKGALAQRKKLLASLKALDAEIAKLSGDSGAAGPRRKKAATRGAKAKVKAKAKAKGKAKAKAAGRPRKRARGRPLVEYVQKALAKSEEGMRVKDVMAAVTKGGYASGSKDFYGIVATALRDENKFQRVRRGVYKLK